MPSASTSCRTETPPKRSSASAYGGLPRAFRRERAASRFAGLRRHAFHVECIDPWLASRRTCPLCKADVVEHFLRSRDGRVPAEDDASTVTSASDGLRRGVLWAPDENRSAGSNASSQPSSQASSLRRPLSPAGQPWPRIPLHVAVPSHPWAAPCRPRGPGGGGPGWGGGSGGGQCAWAGGNGAGRSGDARVEPGSICAGRRGLVARGRLALALS